MGKIAFALMWCTLVICATAAAITNHEDAAVFLGVCAFFFLIALGD